MNWIHMDQDRDRWPDLVNVVINFRVAENAGNFLANCRALNCSRNTLLYGSLSELINLKLLLLYTEVDRTTKKTGSKH